MHYLSAIARSWPTVNASPYKASIQFESNRIQLNAIQNATDRRHTNTRTAHTHCINLNRQDSTRIESYRRVYSLHFLLIFNSNNNNIGSNNSNYCQQTPVLAQNPSPSSFRFDLSCPNCIPKCRAKGNRKRICSTRSSPIDFCHLLFAFAFSLSLFPSLPLSHSRLLHKFNV